MSSTSNYQKIIETWIKKGDLENDSFSRFICYWIAFNCWLYTKTNEVHDRVALSKLYQQEYLFKDFQKLVTKNENLFAELVKVCPIENNRIGNINKPINDVEKFNEVVDVLYEIRCNLFHGSKTDTNKRDIEVAKAATPVLEVIVKNICLKSI
ncbi:MAG: HEPN domain-containing protein [Patescibacteria group bacterium]|nr:HEPN domain-containing protein [Patescibacteria group bacterium]